MLDHTSVVVYRRQDSDSGDIPIYGISTDIPSGCNYYKIIELSNEEINIILTMYNDKRYDEYGEEIAYLLGNTGVNCS